MNKERLQEIKDSIDLQLTVAKSVGTRNELAEEEKELYDEVVRLDNVINELEKWLDDFYKSNRKWYNTELTPHDMKYYREYYINTEAMIVKFDKKLKELKEEK